MLSKLIIRNFKRFDNREVKIDLGSSVVFIGPNNSGKTTAMQALALWHAGVQRWFEKRKGSVARKSGKGVTIGRRDLVSAPVPHANLLWHRHRTRNVYKERGQQKTDNIRIEVTVQGGGWTCGLEFDYANEESFYCRPLRTDTKGQNRILVPDQAKSVQVAFLPPMSGLAAAELSLEQGAVNVRIGEGRTAEVLRNLCYQIAQDSDNKGNWDLLVKRIEALFRVRLNKPEHVPERGEITMSYEEDSVQLDLSSSGRGLQQTLLILAYLYANPRSVLLLDEPDAHLEILRQRDIYRLLEETASEQGNQIIVASHSEVILNEAAGRDDPVVAFVGRPHLMLPKRKTEVHKALATIGFEHYYQAERKGWVLYLEGPTDLKILQAFAKRLDHQAAMRALDRPFVHYVGNQPGAAAEHHSGLQDAIQSLQGIALFDRLSTRFKDIKQLRQLQWRYREIENYLCTQDTLENYVAAMDPDSPSLPSKEDMGVIDGGLFSNETWEKLEKARAMKRQQALHKAIREVEKAMDTLDKGSPWGPEAKVSEDFLVPVFVSYFKRLDRYNTMPKNNLYKLVEFLPDSEIEPEITEKLDAIAEVAKQARPRT